MFVKDKMYFVIVMCFESYFIIDFLGVFRYSFNQLFCGWIVIYFMIFEVKDKRLVNF